MTKKITLVLRDGEFTSFTSNYLRPFWEQFFDIEIWSSRTYDPKRTVFVVWWESLSKERRDTWPAWMQDQGYKVAVDNLWERQTFRTDFYWIEHLYSMYWNESLWWRSLGLQQYHFDKSVQHRALLQMRAQKLERDLLVQQLDTVLPDMLWSYPPQHRVLPNDCHDPQQAQRYMHPSWYDTTWCSVVAETYQDQPLHISEKSYKPLAFFHPFLSLSAPGTLQALRDAGFETYDNIFDESYDTEPDLARRIEIIKQNLFSIDKSAKYDRQTQLRMYYNHDKFFDDIKVKHRLQKEIVEPLIDYAET